MSMSGRETEQWLCSECERIHQVETVERDGMTCSACGNESGALESCDSCGVYHDGGEVSCEPCMRTKMDKD